MRWHTMTSQAGVRRTKRASSPSRRSVVTMADGEEGLGAVEGAPDGIHQEPRRRQRPAPPVARQLDGGRAPVEVPLDVGEATAPHRRSPLAYSTAAPAS